MKRSCFIFLIIVLFISGYAQKFNPPSKGKALVCFASTFHCEVYPEGSWFVFDGENFLTSVGYLDYTIHELDTGNHLFWVGYPRGTITKLSVLVEPIFYETNLQEGKTYVLFPFSIREDYVKYAIHRLNILPLNIKDTAIVLRMKRMFDNLSPESYSKKFIEKKKKKSSEYIENEINHYSEFKKLNDTIRIRKISTESFFPIEILNSKERIY